MKTTSVVALTTCLALVICRSAAAQEAAAQPEAAAAEKKPARDPIYDPEADAKADIAQAVAKARLQRKRVLVTFGGNWCGWCYKLHDLFQSDEDVARLLLNEYVPVRVNVDNNKELLTSFGADNAKQGVPFLVVLGADGQVVTNQNTGDLEDGDHHDPAKVRQFLEKQALDRQNAEAVLAGALEKAKSDDKLVLVHFGAPWCGWCGHLERFLDEQSERLGKDYVVVKIDTDRMDEAAAVVAKLRSKPEGGIPWMTILTPDGTEKINSDGPEGNIGCPVAPAEIEHFLKMLESTKQRLSAEDLSALRAALETRAKELQR